MVLTSLRSDQSFYFLQKILDSSKATTILAEHLHLSRDLNTTGFFFVRDIRLLKHHPQRRCVLEFVIDFPQETHCAVSKFIIGKSRTKGSSRSVSTMLSKLHAYGFGLDCADGISTPKYLGRIKPFKIWFYEKVIGEPLDQLIEQSAPYVKPEKIAEIAYKIHRCAYPTWRSYTATDELEILRRGLIRLIEHQPAWHTRILRLFSQCELISRHLHEFTPTGIHRDFYPEQIIVNHDRYFVLDFDCYTLGDPSLDIGNFIAHIKESALRCQSDMDAFKTLETQLLTEYMQLSKLSSSYNIFAYVWLSLTRLIYLDFFNPARRPLADVLLDYCEKGLTKFIAENLYEIPNRPSNLTDFKFDG